MKSCLDGGKANGFIEMKFATIINRKEEYSMPRGVYDRSKAKPRNGQEKKLNPQPVDKLALLIFQMTEKYGLEGSKQILQKIANAKVKVSWK